jgi:signal transduction histidine kinase
MTVAEQFGDGVFVIDQVPSDLVEPLIAGRHVIHANRLLVGAPHAGSIVVRDVTARCVAARRAELAERRAELAIYASSIAHQINNPLAIINVHAELMKEDLAAMRALHRDEAKRFGDVADSMEELEAAVAAITKITSDMRAFSQTTPVIHANLRRSIEWALKAAAPELRDRAFPITKIEVEGTVALDETRLGRVLVELLRNAAHAIPFGAAERNEVSIVVRAAGSAVAIEVRDTGCGITEDAMDRIFEPKLSVDESGIPRVGVGLLECREIVSAARGAITIDSAEGQGTVVRVELPTKTA